MIYISLDNECLASGHCLPSGHLMVVGDRQSPASIFLGGQYKINYRDPPESISRLLSFELGQRREASLITHPIFSFFHRRTVVAPRAKMPQSVVHVHPDLEQRHDDLVVRHSPRLPCGQKRRRSSSQSSPEWIENR